MDASCVQPPHQGLGLQLRLLEHPARNLEFIGVVRWQQLGELVNERGPSSRGLFRGLFGGLFRGLFRGLFGDSSFLPSGTLSGGGGGGIACLGVAAVSRGDRDRRWAGER
jgi:hypothetical protein